MKDNIRLWVLGCALATVGVLAAGWFLGAQPLLAQMSASHDTISSARNEQVTLQSQLVALHKKAENIGSIKAKAVRASRAVPTGLDAKAFISRLNVLAKRDGLSVQSVMPGAAAAYVAPASIEAKQAAAAAAAAPAPTASPSPSATTAAGATPVAAVVPQAASDSRISGANLVVIPMTVSVSGKDSDILDFSYDVQHDSRLFLVNGFTLAKPPGAVTTGTLTGFVYALKSS